MANSEQDEKEERLPKPTHYDQLFPGRFLKAGLFKGKTRTLTVSEVDIEKLPQDNGKKRVRGILSFKETDMQLVLNTTNGVCVKAMFGGKPQEWIGKRITFSPEKDRFGREVVDAIRIVGSPDIAESLSVEIRLPRKKPKTRELTVTLPSKPAVAPPPVDTMPEEYEPGSDG